MMFPNWLMMLALTLLFESGDWAIKYGPLILLLISAVGNLGQAFALRRKGIHETEMQRLTAVEGLLKTRNDELTELRLKYTTVETEYKTLVGLDMQLLMDIAHEGLTQVIAKLERQLRVRGLSSGRQMDEEDKA